jgi:hypothetical protein
MSVEVNMTALFLIVCMYSGKILAIKFGECPREDFKFSYVSNSLQNGICLWFFHVHRK